MGATLALANGDQMPVVGMGLWKMPRPEAARLVIEAARLGYRHFDSASDYGNEAESGAGLAKVLAEKTCSRDDLWVTSKLWNSNHDPRHVRQAAERSIADLRVDVLDLYLIHFPIATRHVPPEVRYPAGWFYDPDAATPRMELEKVRISDTWGAMEQLVDAGLVRNIGVSNFGTSLLRDLLSYGRIRPAALQVEMHPLLTQEKLLRFCKSEGIAVTAFSPLGSPSYVPLGMAGAGESVLESTAMKEIAKRHGKSPAQVVLRWGVQRGTSVIPKSERIERLRENLAIFDFELAAEEMAAISGLDRNRRFNDPGVFCEAAFNTFCPIYD